MNTSLSFKFPGQGSTLKTRSNTVYPSSKAIKFCLVNITWKGLALHQTFNTLTSSLCASVSSPRSKRDR